MKRRMAIGVLCAVLGATGLTGCTAQETVSFPNSIAVQNVEIAVDRMTVNGNETVKVSPDMAQVGFSVTTEGESTESCQQENTEKLDSLVQYLKDRGIPDSSIRTSRLSMYPQYQWIGDSQRLMGYTMETEVTVTDIPVAQVGELLTNGVSAGANGIHSVAYFSSKYDEAYNEALTKAMEQARAKAETLAAADGKTLGRTLNVTEYSDSQMGRYVESPVYMTEMKSAGEERADMSVMPGEQEVMASISVEFELRTAAAE